MSLVELVVAVVGSTVVTALVTGWFSRRKMNAEADHTSVDTANDAIAMVRGAYGERIATLESEVKTLKHERNDDRKEIIGLSRRLGEVMRAAEMQSQNILSLNGEVCLWRSRVSELLCVLRERGIPLPPWSEGA